MQFTSWKGVVHAVVLPVVLLEANNAPCTSQSEIFHGHDEGKRAEADGQNSNRNEQSEVDGSFSSALGSKSGMIGLKCDGLILTKCASRRWQDAFFQKNDLICGPSPIR